MLPIRMDLVQNHLSPVADNVHAQQQQQGLFAQRSSVAKMQDGGHSKYRQEAAANRINPITKTARLITVKIELIQKCKTSSIKLDS